MIDVDDASVERSGQVRAAHAGLDGQPRVLTYQRERLLVLCQAVAGGDKACIFGVDEMCKVIMQPTHHLHPEPLVGYHVVLDAPIGRRKGKLRGLS